MLTVLKNYLTYGTYTLADAQSRIDYQVAAGRITAAEGAQLAALAASHAQPAEDATAQAVDALRQEVTAPDTDAAQLTLMGKLALMAAAVAEDAAPADPPKLGYRWRRIYADGAIVWELAPDPAAQGTENNPHPYVDGIALVDGHYYLCDGVLCIAVDGKLEEL